MAYEWDDAKRYATIIKHGIDFVLACQILEEQHVRSEKVVDGEMRYIAVGIYEETYIAVVYTMRGANVRLITARKARTNERKQYRASYD